jgi:hypothetical protein
MMGNNLLMGVDHFLYYGNLECLNKDSGHYEAFKNFKILKEQYPNSKFIFTTRDKKKWINERQAMVPKIMKYYMSDESDLMENWLEEWDHFHNEVLTYCEKGSDFIVFNYDEPDAIDDIKDFFKYEIHFLAKYAIPDDFDWEFYLGFYPDLTNAGVTTKEQALDHWWNHGRWEERAYNQQLIEILVEIPDDFDWKFYKKNYKDLNHIESEKEAIHHWFFCGRMEGRPYRKFNATGYMQNNSDLELKDEEAAVKHWEEYGKDQGRIYSGYKRTRI